MYLLNHVLEQQHTAMSLIWMECTMNMNLLWAQHGLCPYWVLICWASSMWNFYFKWSPNVWKSWHLQKTNLYTWVICLHRPDQTLHFNLSWVSSPYMPWWSHVMFKSFQPFFIFLGINGNVAKHMKAWYQPQFHHCSYLKDYYAFIFQ